MSFAERFAALIQDLKVRYVQHEKVYIAKHDNVTKELNFQTSQHKEPILNQKLPDHPWEKTPMDFFKVNSSDDMGTVD